MNDDLMIPDDERPVVPPPPPAEDVIYLDDPRMRELMPLRASSMPLAFLCPGSIRRPRVLAKEHHELADLGTAAHEVLRPLAEGGGIEWSTVPGVAIQYGVDETELRVVVALGYSLWLRVKEQFPEAVTEVALSREIVAGLHLTGHIDILSARERVASIGDWKTGRVDHDYRHQLMAYGVLVFLDDPNIDEIHLRVLWVREREVEPYRFTRPDAQAWLDRVRSHVVEWDGVYRPGPHCLHCPVSHECKASQAIARRDAQAIIGSDGEVDLEALTGDELIALYHRAKAAESIGARVVKAIKARVDVKGDIVGEQAGRLTIVREERREADVARIVPILLNEFNFDGKDLERVTSVSLTDISKVIAEKAGRGYGAPAVRRFDELVKAADAVTLKQIVKLTLKR